MKRQKKVKLIYNPVSGGGKILKELDKIFEIYQDHGFVVDIFRVSHCCKKEEILENIWHEDLNSVYCVWMMYKLKEILVFNI